MASATPNSAPRSNSSTKQNSSPKPASSPSSSSPPATARMASASSPPGTAFLSGSRRASLATNGVSTLAAAKPLSRRMAIATSPSQAHSSSTSSLTSSCSVSSSTGTATKAPLAPHPTARSSPTLAATTPSPSTSSFSSLAAIASFGLPKPTPTSPLTGPGARAPKTRKTRAPSPTQVRSFPAPSRTKVCTNEKPAHLSGPSTSITRNLRAFDRHTLEHHRLLRPVHPISRHLADLLHDVITLRHFAEDRMLACQPTRIGHSNEELRSVRVRSRIRHSQLARLLEAVRRAFRLIRKLVTRSPHAVALRITALDHEIRNYAMKDRAVVQLVALLRARVPLLRSLRKPDEILHRLRCLLFKQLCLDRAFGCLEHSSCRHRFSLSLCHSRRKSAFNSSLLPSRLVRSAPRGPVESAGPLAQSSLC